MQSVSWRDRAACKEVSTENYSVFFPNTNGPKKDKWDAAYEYCQRCPVRRECLLLQLSATDAIDDKVGMFGGLKPNERKLFRRGQRDFVKQTADGTLVTVDRFVGL
jgi:hypothetical protein